MNNKDFSNCIVIKENVNVLEIDDVNEKDKFKVTFHCGDYSVEINFSYDDLVAVGCDKSALKKMLPFIIILNHMLKENEIENESEEN